MDRLGAGRVHDARHARRASSGIGHLRPTGLILLTPLTYSWPARDPRYTYRAQLVASTGTVLKTDVVLESAKSTYSVTYAPGDLPFGDFTVRVSSYLSASPAWTSTAYASAAGRKANLTLGLTTTCA